MAVAIFFMVKGINHLNNFKILKKKKEAEEEEEKEPETKECPFCLSEIPYKATKCKYCASEQTDE